MYFKFLLTSPSQDRRTKCPREIVFLGKGYQSYPVFSFYEKNDKFFVHRVLTKIHDLIKISLEHS